MEIKFDTKQKMSPEDIAKSAMEQISAIKNPEKKVVPQDNQASSTEQKPVEKKVEEPKQEEKETSEKKDHRDSGAEKRIKELTREKKEAEERLALERTELNERLKALEEQNKELQKKTGTSPEDKLNDKVKSVFEERIAQYTKEDAKKPRHERREMTEDEFDEWMNEDLKAAIRWEAKRTMRREQEELAIQEELDYDSKAKNIIEEQSKSDLRVKARHPELDIRETTKKLKAEGLSKEEIHAKLYAENEKYKAVYDIAQEKPEFVKEVMLMPNGPEVLEKEMLKRLAKPSTDPKVAELEAKIAELTDIIQSEGMRRSNIDGSVTSRAKGGVPKVEQIKTDKDKYVEGELAKLGKLGYKFDMDRYKKSVERRKSIPGANVGARDDE